MKAHAKWCLGMLVILFGIMVIGCEEPEPAYKIITFTELYSNAPKDFVMEDGYYGKSVLTKAESHDFFEQLKKDGPEYTTHNWTKDDLHKYFKGLGWDRSTADKEIAWLLTQNHAVIVARDGGTLYTLVK